MVLDGIKPWFSELSEIVTNPVTLANVVQILTEKDYSETELSDALKAISIPNLTVMSIQMAYSLVQKH